MRSWPRALKSAKGRIWLTWFISTGSDDSLAEFKRRCGFEKTRVPRYFVPLTLKGRLALKFGVHRGWKESIPAGIKGRLKKLRRVWNESRSTQTSPAS